MAERPEVTEQTEQGTLDKWAHWLTEGRQRGYAERQIQQLEHFLTGFARRVLGQARPRKGQHLLDIGAGTGLIALAARRRLGPTGRVVASDISLDALKHCRSQAAADGEQARIWFVVANATALPFREGSFDITSTRSVLIYVEDKLVAAAEMHRVLRTRGTVSLFEPINSAALAYLPPPPASEAEVVKAEPPKDESDDDKLLREQREHVMAYYREQERSDLRPMMNFDERNLVGWFKDAGFQTVKLTYEVNLAPPSKAEQRPEVIAMRLGSRPNPLSLSYEEVARKLFGDKADDHLRRVVEESARTAAGSQRLTGAAYLVARKATA